MSAITVIIPVLNGMPYLIEALASLEAQTFRDFEVIVWDNGSTDGTVKEARNWIPSRLPGRVVSDTPLPLHQCLAQMVTEASTEFIARMDADDVCLPERFERQLIYLRKHAEVAVVGGQMELIDECGTSHGPADHAPTRFADILFTFLFSNPMAHPTVMFRRSMILEAGNYSRPKPVEDLDLWMKVAKRSVMANLPETVLRYRRHSGAVCGAIGKPNLEIVEKLDETAEAHLPEMLGISEASLKRLKRRECKLVFPLLLKVACGIHRRTGVTVFSLLCKSQNLFVARCFTCVHDWPSKCLWRILDRFA